MRQDKQNQIPLKLSKEEGIRPRKPFRCAGMNTGTNRPTRRQSIRSVGATVASGALLPTLAIRAQEQDAVPSYLQGYEGNIAPGDAAGELKIVMRTANYYDALTTDPPRAFSSVSQDGGRTWTAAEEEPDLYNAKSKGFFGRAADGTHVYVYNDGPAQRDKASGFPHGGRTSLRYKTKPPGGAWSAEKTFFDAGIKNSYPTLIEVAAGDFRAVWDSGTADTARTHIQFGKLKVKP